MLIFRNFMLLALIFGSVLSYGRSVSKLTDKEIIDAYEYLIGRVLIIRQEQLDFQKDLKWNEFAHRDVGGVQWANPNLEVTYSEAWVGIDNKSCTVVEVPEIQNRYYTVQVLNGWGETTANLNNRTYPKHPFGKFALCLKEATVDLPADTLRVNLPSKKSRILARIEVKQDPKAASELQHKMKMYPTGNPIIAESPKIPEFEHSQLPGIEMFDNAANILSSEKDINPGMGGLQRKVLAVEAAAKNKNSREATALAIKEKAIPAFLAADKKVFTVKNGWGFPHRIGNYGSDYLNRSFVNFAGIWANNMKEAAYMVSSQDLDGNALDGSNYYTMTFSKDQLPDAVVNSFWSVTAVDPKDFKAIPNAANKHSLNNMSEVKKNSDGTLTLYFASKLPQGAPENNWLPTAAGAPFHLTFRFYGPKEVVIKQKYTLPGLVKSSTLANAEAETTY